MSSPAKGKGKSPNYLMFSPLQKNLEMTSLLHKMSSTMGKNKFKDTFIENEIYHVYNRTNNKEVLFKTEEDRYGFLNRFDHYTSPFLDTFSWNLLPNHFHLLIKVKSFEVITAFLKSKHIKELCSTEKKFLKQKVTIHDLIDNVFQRFLISYTMKFNSRHERKGNLLHRPFKHVLVNKAAQFTQTAIYINANAQKHKIVADFTKYKWSSYHTILSDKQTKLLRTELLEWFGGKTQFIKVVKEKTEYYYNCDTAIEVD
ncbi:hypothetical protein BH11BAC4_BH11BAC4_15570 [soil metagenome]